MSNNIFSASVFYRNPKAALEWLERAFGFEVTMLLESPDGSVAHAEMNLGGRGRLMLGGEWSEWAKSPESVDGANTQSVHVDLEADIDAHCERARAAGAVVVASPENQFYGARTYRAADPEGHVWTFAQWVAELPPRAEAEKATGLKIRAKDWD